MKSKRSNKIIRACTDASSVNFYVDVIPDLCKDGFEIVSVSSDGPSLQKVRNAGARVEVVEMQRRISLMKDFKSLCKLIKVFWHEKPLMVHSLTPKAGLLCMIAAKITGVPVRVHTFTGLIFPTSLGFTRKILMATDSLTCACATHIIPEGEGVKSDLSNNRITRKPLRILGNGNVKGVDLQAFDPDSEYIRQEASKIRKKGHFTFIFVGRVVGDKGINELVEAFDRLHSEFPETHLILVGHEEQELDPLREETFLKITTHPNIRAVGIQDDVRPWLAASDALVLPSYREGFPNVVIEAGAMGLPAIVTDVNGSREIIIPGRNGVIIPPRDSNALYTAMKEFVTQPEKVKQMSREARPLIASRFDQKYVKQCLKDFYASILPK